MGISRSRCFLFFGFVFLLFLLIVPFTLAIGLGGKALSPVMYKPGITITNEYFITGTERPVEVLLDTGGIFKHVKVTEVVNNQFNLILDFPKGENIPPGSYSISVAVREIPTPKELQAAGVGVFAGVSKNIEVIVYSMDKDVKIGLNAPNINQGSDVQFELGVSSVTYQDIASVRGEITIYDAQRKELGKISTEEKPLPSLEGVNFRPMFESNYLPVAEYSAKAVVFYDGKQESVNTTFLIGNMDVLLKDHTKELTTGYSEFSAQVASNWGNPLRNVYAKVFFDGQELLQTPSMNLEPWQEGTLKGIMKVDLALGERVGELQLFFEGESKKLPLKVKVIEETSPIVAPTPELTEETKKEIQEAQPFRLVPAIVTFVILAIILVLVLLRRRYKEGKVDDF